MRIANINGNLVIAGHTFSMKDMTHMSDTIWIPKDGSEDSVIVKKAAHDKSRPVSTVSVVYQYLGDRVIGKKVFVKDYLSFQTRYCLLVRAAPLNKSLSERETSVSLSSAFSATPEQFAKVATVSRSTLP